MTRNALTAERLRSQVTYDQDTGEMRWSVRRKGVSIGRLVGRVTSEGYREAGIDGLTYLVHRLAWLYVYGSWPNDQIDHINGNKADNRIANLRDVDCTTNHRGYRSQRRNATGFTGVYFARGNKHRFIAQIYKRGKCFRLGTFDTAEAAHSAFLKARADYRNQS